MREWLARSGQQGAVEFYIAFNDDHGELRQNPRLGGEYQHLAHSVLFAVEADSGKVTELSLFEGLRIPPVVRIEPDLTYLLTRESTRDLTLANEDSAIQDEYVVERDGKKYQFRIYAYEDGVHAYAERLGFSVDLQDVRDMLAVTRHHMKDGIVRDDPRPIDMPSGIAIEFDQDF